jgi:soluble lytic murein transglycosylase
MNRSLRLRRWRIVLLALLAVLLTAAALVASGFLLAETWRARGAASTDSLAAAPTDLPSPQSSPMPRLLPTPRPTFTPTAAPTATPSPTLTPTAIEPTATPSSTVVVAPTAAAATLPATGLASAAGAPAEVVLDPAPPALATAEALFLEGRYAEAAAQFSAQLAAGGDVAARARWGLGRALRAQRRWAEAAAVFVEVIASDPDPARRRQARFLLGESLAGQGQWPAAIDAYRAYLEDGGLARGEAWEQIANAQRQLAAWDQAEAAYRQAIDAAPDVSTAVRLREDLARMWLDQGQADKALAEYDAILSVARNANYRAEIFYRAGEALRLAGRTTEAVARYQAAADAAPTSSYAHAAIVALLDLGAPVDEYQRGVINYYNGVYGLAVAALERYLASDPDGRGGQAYDFLALAHNRLGAYAEAIAAWDRVIERFPTCPCWGQAWLRRAAAQAALGDVARARAGLLAFVEAYPEHELAAEALYQAAKLLETTGDCQGAAQAYRDLQARYPGSEAGAKGLQAAAMCLYEQGQWEAAATDLRTLLGAYPGGDANLLGMARLWLGKALLAAGQPEAAADAWRALAAQPETYYGQRALALAQAAGLDLGVTLSAAPPPSPDDQAATEAWLRTWIADAPAGELAGLSPRLRADADLARALELWNLGKAAEAVQGFAVVRQRYNDDALALYQLALFFRDLGAYRQSIQAAERVAALSPVRLADAPLFLQRLAYPTYFADLVEAEAAARSLDPLLIYAMIRQESLFEAHATSHAAAQGLMQVIPPTGEWIAGRLGWDGYSRELLYLPYVSVKFGTYYLWSTLQMVDGNIAAALSGYNAGPGNARRWLQQANGDDDRFFMAITLSEPRLYVQRILAYYATYRRLYGR